MTKDLHAVAQSLYKEKGARLTVSDIARTAGVSRPTVYKQLGSKASILARIAYEDGKRPALQDIDSRLMSAVRLVAGRRGFSAMTLEEVADEAGVGMTTIFRRFGTKHELLGEFVASQAPNRFLTEDVINPDAGLQGLHRIVSVLLKFMHENHVFVRLVFSGTEEDRAYLRGLRSNSGTTFDRLCGFFSAQFADGHIEANASPQALTRNLFGMVYAHAVLNAEQGEIDLNESNAAIIAMFAPLFKETHE